VSDRLEALGARLKDGAERLLDYREIEARSLELGCHTTERTLRFYVSEGVLPAPPARRGGRTPVYEEGWILGALLAIHTMKTRLGRSLAEIREVIRNLKEDPAILAEKLQALYEDVLERSAGGGTDDGGGFAQVPLTVEQSRQVVDAFFRRVTGAGGEPVRQPSEVSILDLVTDRVSGGAAQPERVELEPASLAPEVLPDDAVLLERARALEEMYITRFDERLAEARKVPNPVDGTLLSAGPRDRTHHKRSRSDDVVDLMKRHQIYDRALLDAMPLDEVSSYRYFTRSIFGRKDVRLVLAACCVSPLEELLTRRCASTPSGIAELERALELVQVRGRATHCVGVLSTTGWQPGTEHLLPKSQGLMVVLVESAGGTRWKLNHSGDERWGPLLRLFDPEGEREKIDRARGFLESHPELVIRGGHVIVKNVREDLGVEARVLMRAIAELLGRDGDLSLMEVGGRQIIKRKRL
jgi:DNA-binding transcriptional MerR regulator